MKKQALKDRYWIIAYDCDDKCGGFGDIRATTDNFGEAIDHFIECNEEFGYAHLYDSLENESLKKTYGDVFN